MIASVPFAALAEATGPVEGVEYVVWDGAEPPPRDDIELVVLDYRNARMTLERLDALPAIAVVQTQTAASTGSSSTCPTACCSPTPAASTTTRPPSWRWGSPSPRCGGSTGRCASTATGAAAAMHAASRTAT